MASLQNYERRAFPNPTALLYATQQNRAKLLIGAFDDVRCGLVFANKQDHR
jgi:hypothetical protein